MPDYIQQVRQALRSRWWRYRLSKQSLRGLLWGYDARGGYGDSDAETIERLRLCVFEANQLLAEFAADKATGWKREYGEEIEDAKDAKENQ